MSSIFGEDLPQWVSDMQSGKTLINNPDNSISTMKSITFNADGKVYLAPSIRLVDGQPIQLSPEQAIKFAIQQQDAIPFNSQEEADTYDKALHQKEYERLGIGSSLFNQWK